MRLPALLCILSLGAIASADRLIDIPTARKIPFDDFRYEFRSEPFVAGSFEQYLGLGVGKSFELDLRSVEQRGDRQVGTFDFAYDFIAAIPNVSPGISVGVQDAADRTLDGRRYYVATTYREAMQVINESVKADITVGVQTGRLSSPFVGFLLPFSKEVFLIGEHNGYRISAGFEIRPAANLSVRYYTRGSSAMLSFSLSSRF